MLRRGTRTLAAILATTALIALSGCDTAEERAEGHYQSALELLEAGDVDRALVELRNVFDLDPQHLEARKIFAEQLMKSGDQQAAFSQYVLLSEMDPENLDARVVLARLAIQNNMWDVAQRHGLKAYDLAPENADVKLVKLVLDYQKAVEGSDDSARREAINQLTEVKAEAEDASIGRQILIDSALRDGDYAKALEEIDSYLAEDPQSEQFHLLRLRILGALGDRDGIRGQLEDMVRRFPENEAYSSDLIRWYVAEGNPDAAEAYIRERAAAAEGDQAVAEQVLLVNFLRQARGTEQALAEVEKLVDAGLDDNLFRSLRAGLKFDAGDRDAALAELESVVGSAEPGEATNRYKIALARMHQAVGNQVAARQRVEEVLEADATNVEAIKMRSAWLIAEDKADAAISDLRASLQNAPEDPQIMALLAEAHLRNGSRDLAREMLALAFQSSNAAPEHALPYARFLVAEDALATAEDALIQSLRARPNNLDALALLGQIYVRQQDWARSEQVEGTLRRLETERATEVADGLQVARLRGQNRNDEAFELLTGLAESSEGVGAAEVAIVRTHLSNGDIQLAEDYVTGLVESTDNSPAARMLKAAVLRVSEKFDDALAIYRSILDETPEAENVWRAAFSLELARGDQEAARSVLEEALTAMPEAPNLQWALAGVLEQDGDIDGAIAIYEKLYEALPNSPIVANNLASLVATYRDDDASLERAFVIARRLRGAEIPAFQDTYGWIAYRRGQYDEALENLEPAAAGLQSDPVVQYHYGMALAANGRTEEAIAQLQAAIDLAGPADTRPQFARAREEIDRLKAAAESAPSAN